MEGGIRSVRQIMIFFFFFLFCWSITLSSKRNTDSYLLRNVGNFLLSFRVISGVSRRGGPDPGQLEPRLA